MVPRASTYPSPGAGEPRSLAVVLRDCHLDSSYVCSEDWPRLHRVLGELERWLPATWSMRPTEAPSEETERELAEAEERGVVNEGWALRRGMHAAEALLLGICEHMSRLRRQLGSWARLRDQAQAIRTRAAPLSGRATLVDGALSRHVDIAPSSDDEEMLVEVAVRQDHGRATQAATEYFCWLRYCDLVEETDSQPPCRELFRLHLQREFEAGRYEYPTFLEAVQEATPAEAMERRGRLFVEAANRTD